jgi:hypothetical protein
LSDIAWNAVRGWKRGTAATTCMGADFADFTTSKSDRPRNGEAECRFPVGICAAGIEGDQRRDHKAVAALHRFRVDHLKEGEHFCSFKINSGGVN